MKNTILAFVLATFTSAHADRPRPEGFATSDFEANKTFGLGLELGDIGGVSGKLFVTRNQAIDFGIGDLYEGYYVDHNNGGIHLYADYLWHPFVLTKVDAFELPLYIGVGGRFWDFGYACDAGGNNCRSANVFGIRVPVGLTFDFNHVPLDVFVQAVPTLDFFHQYQPHAVYLDVDFSLGIRYWFK